MINGQTHQYYGLVLLNLQGALDMPSRVGSPFYNWGDENQALTHGDDIVWQSRKITAEVLADNPRTSAKKLADLPREFLLDTGKGIFTVSLYSLVELKEYVNGKSRMRMTFIENAPSQNATIPSSPIGGSGVLIDGFHFKNDLNLNVTKVSVEDNLPNQKKSDATVYGTHKKNTQYRSFYALQIDCSYQGETMMQDIDILKAILSQSGERELTYNGRRFKCFLSQGFSVRIRKSVAIFQLKLNVINEAVPFVEDSFVAEGFIANI